MSAHERVIQVEITKAHRLHNDPPEPVESDKPQRKHVPQMPDFDAMVAAIETKFKVAISADSAAHSHRLEAGKMLVKLRETFDEYHAKCSAARITMSLADHLDAARPTWPKFLKCYFSKSLRDVRRCMALARADDPAAAVARERKTASDGMRRTREKKRTNVSPLASETKTAERSVADAYAKRKEITKKQWNSETKTRWRLEWIAHLMGRRFSRKELADVIERLDGLTLSENLLAGFMHELRLELQYISAEQPADDTAAAAE